MTSEKYIQPMLCLSLLVLFGSTAFAQSSTAGERDVWISLGPEGGSVHSLSIDPRNPGTIYAGTDTGPFKSEDGAQSWSRSNVPNGIYAPNCILVFDPRDPLVVYGKPSPNHSGYLYRSVDGGLTWQDIGPAGEAPGPGGIAPRIGIGEFVLDPQQTGTMFVTSPQYGIFKSIDGAQSWHESNAGLTSLYVQTLLISPHDHHELYAGTIAGVFKSTDSGETWKIVLDKGRTRYALAADPWSPALCMSHHGPTVYSKARMAATPGSRLPQDWERRLSI
jgi:photosystem II stability/assembly factor-like uncharacterized protein